MLIINFNTLTAIDILNFANKVSLDFFFTRNSKNVMWNQRSVNKRFTRSNNVSSMHSHMLAVGDQMFSFNTTFVSNYDRSLAPSFFTTDFNLPINFSHDGRVFWLSRFKNFSYSRQATSNVLGTACFTRRFGEDMPRANTFTWRDFDIGLFRKIVEIKNLS